MTRILWGGLLLGLLPALAYVGLTAGFRMDMLSFGDVFGAVRSWLSPALMGGTALLVVILGLSLTSRRLAVAAAALIFAVGSGGILYSLSEMKRVGGSVPPIHDISTDTIDPPAFSVTAAERTERQNPAAYDGAQSAPQIAAYPDLAPIVVGVPTDVAFDSAKAAMKKAGVTLKSADLATGIIEGTATTFWFGFQDDVVIRVREGEGDVSVIDIRSKSRIGRSDLGANAARIRVIRDAILAEVPAA